jgi:hypothetical protein
MASIFPSPELEISPTVPKSSISREGFASLDEARVTHCRHCLPLGETFPQTSGENFPESLLEMAC